MNRHDRRTEANPEASHRAFPLAFAIAALVLGTALTTSIHAKDGPGVETTDVEVANEAPCHADAADRPRIQIGLLLDTSNSMDGLIHQAKARLWKIVNELLYTRRQGAMPLFEVALYEYGKSTLPAEEHWLRQVVPLTDDLDQVSQALFELTTKGGKEYCGAVIERAVRELGFSERPEDLKILFIAGNEPFNQGPVPFAEACRDAIARGITVNTIFCGPEQQGIATSWQQGAMLADGGFSFIDSNQAVASIPAPQDEEIQKLGSDLNHTYLPYGSLGRANHTRQWAQDENAAQVAEGSAVSRAVCKANGFYLNGTWDLVDAVEQGTVELDELPEKDLPEPMRTMTPAQRSAHVQSKAADRKRIQSRINELNAARTAYVAEKRAEQAKEAGQGADTDSFDDAVTACLREQAARCGFEWIEKASVNEGTEKNTENESSVNDSGAKEDGTKTSVSEDSSPESVETPAKPRASERGARPAPEAARQQLPEAPKGGSLRKP